MNYTPDPGPTDNVLPEEVAFQSTGFSLEDAVQIHLWDLVVQCEKLRKQQKFDLVKLLQAEGEDLALAYENKELFIISYFHQNKQV
jgi:hypothetical protein